MFELSNWVAIDEINKLIELQLLKPEGKGKALHYILSQTLMIILTIRLTILIL
jgi:hypothetical protein